MAATRHGPFDSVPPVIALDTCFLFAAINSLDDCHAQARPVYEALVDSGTPVAICRPILRLEFRSVLVATANRLERSELLDVVEDAQLRGRRQGQLFRASVGRSLRAKREFFIPAGEQLLREYLAPMRVVSVRLTNQLIEDSQREATEWSLRAFDALIVAMARDVAASVGLDRAFVATTDKDFERVDDADLWGRR